MTNIILNSPGNPVSTHFTIRKQGHTANNWMITNPIRFQTEALRHAPSQQQKKRVQVKSLRDSNIPEEEQAAKKRGRKKKNTRKMWYGEARCLEFPPKINEYLSQKLLI